MCNTTLSSTGLPDTAGELTGKSLKENKNLFISSSLKKIIFPIFGFLFRKGIGIFKIVLRVWNINLAI